MNRYFLFLIVVATFIACQNDNNADGVKEIRSGGSNADLVRNPVSADLPTDTSQLARITFEEKEFDFGEADEGDIVTHQFKFTNTGKVPLTIIKARSSCGCTIPEYPEEPVPPGGTGVVTAKFNTEGKMNQQRKMIYITANTYPNESSVLLKGFVKPK